VYWKGSHWKRMSELLEASLRPAQPPPQGSST
jgi:uncharacterized protein with PIN domain